MNKINLNHIFWIVTKVIGQLKSKNILPNIVVFLISTYKNLNLYNLL